jgi:hypothetical protein
VTLCRPSPAGSAQGGQRAGLCQGNGTAPRQIGALKRAGAWRDSAASTAPTADMGHVPAHVSRGWRVAPTPGRRRGQRAAPRHEGEWGRGRRSPPALPRYRRRSCSREPAERSGAKRTAGQRRYDEPRRWEQRDRGRRAFKLVSLQSSSSSRHPFRTRLAEAFALAPVAAGGWLVCIALALVLSDEADRESRRVSRRGRPAPNLDHRPNQPPHEEAQDGDKDDCNRPHPTVT